MLKTCTLILIFRGQIENNRSISTVYFVSSREPITVGYSFILNQSTTFKYFTHELIRLIGRNFNKNTVNVTFLCSICQLNGLTFHKLLLVTTTIYSCCGGSSSCALKNEYIYKRARRQKNNCTFNSYGKVPRKPFSNLTTTAKSHPGQEETSRVKKE